jgi:hypothetical protein
MGETAANNLARAYCKMFSSGTIDGTLLGDADGTVLGDSDGKPLGPAEGVVDGTIEGNSDGETLGIERYPEFCVNQAIDTCRSNFISAFRQLNCGRLSDEDKSNYRRDCRVQVLTMV